MDRGKYMKRWRKISATVRALAESSDSEDDSSQQSDPIDPFNSVINSDETEAHTVSDNEASDAAASDSVLDYGYTDIIESSDSEGSSDFNEGNSDEDNDQPLSEQLASWANKNKCTRSSLNELLGILRAHGNSLPKDARSLLQTPRVVETVDKCGGQYIYFGIESGVKRIMSQNSFPLDTLDSVELSVSVDGVPLFKSSNVQLWPILCSFLQCEPFMVALYCGSAKPNSVEDYLENFLQEFIRLKEDGIIYDTKRFSLSIRAFICDAPARAFLKCIKGHNAYFACERCLIRGQWQGRLVFHADGSFPLRTEEMFWNLQYETHQLQRSPLIDAGIKCIAAFSLDYMHLVCLGVVKRMLCYLKQGPKESKLSYRHISELSTKLLALNGKMPSEFARQPRSLMEMDKWKATEFRQFLLYTGPIVLRNTVSNDVYNHFLVLTVAMSILLNSSDEQRNAYLPYAQELLVYFVRKCKDIYGETYCL